MTTHLLNFKETSIVLGQGVCQSALIEDLCKTRSIALICDDHVKDLYATSLLKKLQSLSDDIFLFSFPAGEASKSRETKSFLEDQMLSHGLTHDTTILALGGGVCLDLAGFIAATYCRGIPFISLPTTLLAMVDASIGGKTAVNTPYGKNLIGAFYLPSAIVIDYDFLKTLSFDALIEGLMEMIKIAWVCDEKLFNEIEERKDFIIEKKEELHPFIKKACELKLKIVSQDFDEKKGLRRILNFGHTVAHALEKKSEYTLPHGQAVALGMIAESFMSCELDLLKRSDFNRLVKLIKPYLKKINFDTHRVYELMALDKKAHEGAPRFVLPIEVGRVGDYQGQYCSRVEKDLVLDALKLIQEI